MLAQNQVFAASGVAFCRRKWNKNAGRWSRCTTFSKNPEGWEICSNVPQYLRFVFCERLAYSSETACIKESTQGKDANPRLIITYLFRGCHFLFFFSFSFILCYGEELVLVSFFVDSRAFLHDLLQVCSCEKDRTQEKQGDSRWNFLEGPGELYTRNYRNCQALSLWKLDLFEMSTIRR